MKARHCLLYLLILSGGLSAGYKIGRNAQKNLDRPKIHVLKTQLERYEDPAIYREAERVSRITGADLDQVLVFIESKEVTEP